MEESVASHTPRWSDWPRWIKQAVPLFVQVLPAFVALTLLAAFTTVSILLILGKAAFHLASLCSPLIFLVLALALRRAGMLGDRPVLRTAVGTGSPWRNFFRVAAPLALVIGIALNALAVLAMLGSDIGAWKRGALPLTTLPLDLFSAEKRPLLVMLYTTAVEQQLSLMPLFVIMGGRLEPYLVAAVMAGRETWSSAGRSGAAQQIAEARARPDAAADAVRSDPAGDSESAGCHQQLAWCRAATGKHRWLAVLLLPDRRSRAGHHRPTPAIAPFCARKKPGHEPGFCCSAFAEQCWSLMRQSPGPCSAGWRRVRPFRQEILIGCSEPSHHLCNCSCFVGKDHPGHRLLAPPSHSERFFRYATGPLQK